MTDSSTVAFPGVPAKRVTGVDWNVKAIRNPIVSRWSLALSLSDVTKLLRGFQPVEMEDRWMSCAKGPDKNGTFMVHIYRSWTSEEQFRIKANITALNDLATKGSGYQAEIEDITWDNGPAHSTEEDAKHMAVMVCRGLLGCELEQAS